METRQDYEQTLSKNRGQSSQNLVLEWLKHLEKVEVPVEEVTEVRATEPYALTEKGSSTGPLNSPRTPIRSRQRCINLDELSPTNTNFTDTSIFDTPQKGSSGPCGLAGPESRDYDGFSSSAATSNDELCCDDVATQDIDDIRVETPPVASFVTETENLGSYDPPTELEFLGDTDEAAQEVPIITIDPEQPRLIWITSCLQCILADMPCSRTLPACSRCIRNGRGDVCLLHRRKLLEEQIPGNAAKNEIPVLLKVRDEDQVSWDRKQVAKEELLEIWKHRQDRNNWVMPLNTGRIGFYNIHGFRMPGLTRHPGEGSGRKTLLAMQLAS